MQTAVTFEQPVCGRPVIRGLTAKQRRVFEQRMRTEPGTMGARFDVVSLR